MEPSYKSYRLHRSSRGRAPTVASGRAGVSSVSRQGSELAVRVMREGGNAFDAAFALALGLALYHPQAGNLGGGGYLLYKKAGEKAPRYINYRERAPLASRREAFVDGDGRIDPDVTSSGTSSVCVPGTVKAFFTLQRENGRLDAGPILADLARRARDGFPVTQYQADCLNRLAPRLAASPESRRIYLREGGYRAGDRLANPHLAETYEILSRDGERAFYEGRIADMIERDISGNGGFLTVDDLRSYRVLRGEPIRREMKDRIVWTVPPEGGGGILIEILAIANGVIADGAIAGGATTGGAVDRPLTPLSPEHHHILCQAAKMAFIDRLVYLGEGGGNAFRELLHGGYAKRLAGLIDRDRDRAVGEFVSAMGREDVYPHDLLGTTGTDTTHFNIIDGEGNGVSNSYTLNLRFGSKWSIDGAGFLMNGSMDAFSFVEGVPNYFNVIGSRPNLFEPGKRPASNMAPVIVTRRGEIDMLVGSPGGPTIPTTLAAIIQAIIACGQDPGDCIAADRFHHQGWPDVLYGEPGSDNSPLSRELSSLGYTVKARSDPISDVHGVFRRGEGYLLVSDFRREGCALAL